jgi:hypothetical protein
LEEEMLLPANGMGMVKSGEAGDLPPFIPIEGIALEAQTGSAAFGKTHVFGITVPFGTTGATGAEQGPEWRTSIGT